MNKKTTFQPDEDDCGRAIASIMPGLNFLEMVRHACSGESDELSARPSRALDEVASSHADSLAAAWERNRGDDTQLEVKIEAGDTEVIYTYSVGDE